MHEPRLARPRWATRSTMLALVLAAAIPLLWPAIPPLTDLPGHMGRYRVATGIGESADLARAFSYEWRLLGNLGVDLLVIPLERLFGLELAVKLIVLAIPPLTVAGMLWTAREAHGELPPTAAFALPLAYAWPFHFGFVNFAVGVALAFLSLALWLRLGRTGRLRLRLALFVAMSWLLWVVHSFGWGMFGLFAYGSELVRRRSTGEGWVRTAVGAGLVCLPLALPALTMFFEPRSAQTATGDWFNFEAKWDWLVSILRDRWRWFDIASAGVLGLVLVVAAFQRGMRFSATLAVPAAIAVVAFLLLPRIITGSNYADMRLIPYAIAIAVLAIGVRPGSPRLAAALAIAAVAFFGVRIAATTASFAFYDRLHRSEVAAVEAIPRGAAVLALVGRPCKRAWSTDRLDHLPSIAIVRRDAFVNDQWDAESAQLIRIRHAGAGRYATDPSQLVYPRGCRSEGSDFATAIRRFDRGAFDLVWTIGFPPADLPGLTPVWSNGRSALYRVSGPAAR